MDKSDIAEYKPLYLQTAKEYIEKLRNNSTLSTDDAVNEFYMSAHSLKSQSLVMSYNETGMLSGTLEKIGRALKEKTLEQTTTLRETILVAIEKLAQSIRNIEEHDTELPTSEEMEKLTTASGITLS